MIDAQQRMSVETSVWDDHSTTLRLASSGGDKL